MSDGNLIDNHIHVGLVGNHWPKLGKMSEWYREQLGFKIFLMFAGVKPEEVSDTHLTEAIIKTIDSSLVDKVVCLALDPVYDIKGVRNEGASHMWVDNDYIVNELQPKSNKVLLGASVHPYDPEFKTRVSKYVDKKAVLIKWLPSAQQINLADKRVADALEFLATAKNGKPLPLLLHVGGEYAIPTTDERTSTYDFLCWSWLESVRNWFRFKNHYHTPDIKAIEKNLRRGLDTGATIIFAHCGMPYFANGLLAFLEHSDFPVVKKYLEQNDKNLYPGKCYADISAFSTPFRKEYFDDIRKLPSDYLIYGSDYPTPVFEIYSDEKEKMKDFKAMINGDLERIVVPQDNMLDVNYKMLHQAFPGHKLFTNFSKLI